MPRAKTTPFNLLLTDADKTLLDALAEQRGMSRGQVLRECIRTAHQMQVAGVPLCASGQPCYVPQMHALNRR